MSQGAEWLSQLLDFDLRNHVRVTGWSISFRNWVLALSPPCVALGSSNCRHRGVREHLRPSVTPLSMLEASLVPLRGSQGLSTGTGPCYFQQQRKQQEWQKSLSLSFFFFRRFLFQQSRKGKGGGKAKRKKGRKNLLMPWGECSSYLPWQREGLGRDSKVRFPRVITRKFHLTLPILNYG